MKKTCTGLLRYVLPIVALAAATQAKPPAAEPQYELSFVDATTTWGFDNLLAGIMAHAAACGDVDNDGDLDLFVGTFCDRPAEAYTGQSGPVPNILLKNEGERFIDSGQETVVMKARTSGAVFADFDNDGDLDLYVANNSKNRGLRVANKLYENIGGRLRDVSGGNAACVIMGSRSVGVFDCDGDRLLDLLVTGDSWTGGETKLFRNTGGLKFRDVTADAGLPGTLPALGVITPDFDNDGRPDLFVSQSNRLFLSRGDGTFRAVDSSAFQYEPLNREDTPCGVAHGDLDRDGDPDIVIVDHGQPARLHVFENRGLRDGVPEFKDITPELGLDYRFPSWTRDRRHLKHAHVEIADFDNDGWPDIFPSATYNDGGADRPFIVRNRGLRDGRLRFDLPPVEKASGYYAAGPTGDYDRDGRLDVFFACWWPEIPSSLLLNRSRGGHWLRVKVVGRSINRMGIGAKVRVYNPGRLGDPDALLGFQEISISQGFCSGQEAVAHFGLGEATRCDLEIELPFKRGVIQRRNLDADRLVVVTEK